MAYVHMRKSEPREEDRLATVVHFSWVLEVSSLTAVAFEHGFLTQPHSQASASCPSPAAHPLHGLRKILLDSELTLALPCSVPSYGSLVIINLSYPLS